MGFGNKTRKVTIKKKKNKTRKVLFEIDSCLHSQKLEESTIIWQWQTNPNSTLCFRTGREYVNKC